MALKITIEHVSQGATIEDGGNLENTTTSAQINQALAGQRITHLIVHQWTEAQLRGLVQYAQAINNGADTSAIETAVSAAIP